MGGVVPIALNGRRCPRRLLARPKLRFQWREEHCRNRFDWEAVFTHLTGTHLSISPVLDTRAAARSLSFFKFDRPARARAEAPPVRSESETCGAPQTIMPCTADKRAGG